MTAKLLQVDYQEVMVGEQKDDVLRLKSQTGKFPLLETPDGHLLFESTCIAKFLARQRPNFYGANDFESKQTTIQ